MRSEFTLFSDTKAALGNLMRAVGTSRDGSVRVEWPDDRRTVEDALSELPESADWPGLFDVLLEARGAEKRVALVLDHDGPMAVVLLRSTGHHTWEPATQWIVPGFLFPVRPGCTQTVLEALQLSVEVGWWRCPEPPPSGSRVQNFRQRQKHELSCATDFDTYWKQSGHLHTVQQAQRRCKDFVLKIDPEDGAEWTIRNCEQKWRSDPEIPEPRLEDRIAAAKFLEQSGRHHTHVLFDGDTAIAGLTHLAHRDCVVAHMTYRRPEYESKKVGTFIYEAVFQWAARSGYRTVDIGGGFKYKNRWAPPNGYIYEFTVAPAERYGALKRLFQRLKW